MLGLVCLEDVLIVPASDVQDLLDDAALTNRGCDRAALSPDSAGPIAATRGSMRPRTHSGTGKSL